MTHFNDIPSNTQSANDIGQKPSNATAAKDLASHGNDGVVLFEYPHLSASVYSIEQHPLKMVELEISLSSTSAAGLEKHQAAIYETLRGLIRKGMAAHTLAAKLIESKGYRYEKGFREFSYKNSTGEIYSTGISFLPTIAGYTYLIQNWGAIILRLRNLLGGDVVTDEAKSLSVQVVESVKPVVAEQQSSGFVETKVEGGEMGELITIAGIEIKQDSEGRFSLNDLHRAAGGEARHKPGNWSVLEQTKELIAEIEIAGYPAIHARQGFGTYVSKELVYAYAMWISPKFHLEVIRTYDKVARGELMQTSKPQEDKALSSKVAAELAIMQCYTEMLKPAPSSQLYMFQRIATNNNLDGSFLPDYTVDAPTDNSGGSSLPTAPVTTLLKENGIKESPATYNKMMQRAGILEKRQRRSTTSDSGTKDFWSITTEGLIYGKNITNPRNPRETQPHWYVDRFDELHNAVSRVEA